MTNKKNTKKITRTISANAAVRASTEAVKRQPTGLSRDELRQIIIDMIG